MTARARAVARPSRKADDSPLHTAPVPGPQPPAFERNDPYAPTTENRPFPLDRGPLGLTRDPGWQMSFGERAALEGVLSQLKPGLAVEIGSAEGGSLERIAAHSREVHSIDVDHAPLRRSLPTHVMLHTGSSAQLLEPLLADFAAEGREVDFALVDGDHSFEGVRDDLIALLRSAVTGRSAIVIHDTMNAEIRAGIESVEVETYPRVVYYEPDFVAGYMYQDGICHGAVWGGLGLILTDSDRSPDYPIGPRQTRYYEPFEALHRYRREVVLAADAPASS